MGLLKSGKSRRGRCKIMPTMRDIALEHWSSEPGKIWFSKGKIKQIAWLQWYALGESNPSFQNENLAS